MLFSKKCTCAKSRFPNNLKQSIERIKYFSFWNVSSREGKVSSIRRTTNLQFQDPPKIIISNEKVTSVLQLTSNSSAVSPLTCYQPIAQRPVVESRQFPGNFPDIWLFSFPEPISQWYLSMEICFQKVARRCLPLIRRGYMRRLLFYTCNTFYALIKAFMYCRCSKRENEVASFRK